MSDVAKFKQLIDGSSSIVIVQADNPDGDSLGSALALEAILGDYGKEVSLYCGVDMPDYLKYLQGWSRVSYGLPSDFDMVIYVDVSTTSLFGKATEDGTLSKLATKPSIVLDHHAETSNDLTAQLIINDGSRSSTCELIYDVCHEAKLPMPSEALVPLATGILGDTQGLSNQLTSALTYRVMADLVEAGLDRPELEETRREASKMPESIFKFKARLIERTLFAADGKIAYVYITQDEINNYSPLYNPGPLIQPDMLQTVGVKVGLVFKFYNDGRVTAMIRCNPGAEIANKIAVAFGGGGHGFAAGFKISDGRSFNEIKADCIKTATELLGTL